VLQQTAVFKAGSVNPPVDQAMSKQAGDVEAIPAFKRKAEVADLDDSGNETAKRFKQDQTEIENVDSAPARCVFVLLAVLDID
jgi:hypothetical protein